MSSWAGVGVMSGTSLDGLDLCCVEFTGDYTTDTWSHRFLKAVTVPYDAEWQERLRTADDISGEQLAKLHADYGHYIGHKVMEFIEENELSPNFVASHGHTVFHQPSSGFTFQLGDGETIVSYLKGPLVANFRNKDVALGGEGAPLVPVGETYLFSQYDCCINMGGIVNMSVADRGFDVCPCNMLLNFLAERYDSNLEYDENGAIARKGNILEDVLNELDAVPFYAQSSPKSLGKEWFEDTILPIIITEMSKPDHVGDLLRTSVEHISNQIVNMLEKAWKDMSTPKSLLVTGGGSLNNFLMERIRDKIKSRELNIAITESDEDTIQFKEALIFAFLGLRCLLGLPNISKTVTGSRMDSVSGSIHLPPTVSPLANAANTDYRFHFRAAISRGVVPSLRKKSEM